MKATLLLAKGEEHIAVSDMQKILLQGIVDNVFSNYTDDEVYAMWRDLKAMATIGIHDKHSRLMAIFDGLHIVFSTMLGEGIEIDEYGIKFDCGDKQFVLSAGSGMRKLGEDPNAIDWDWCKNQVACLDKEPPEGSGIEVGEVE